MTDVLFSQSTSFFWIVVSGRFGHFSASSPAACIQTKCHLGTRKIWAQAWLLNEHVLVSTNIAEVFLFGVENGDSSLQLLQQKMLSVFLIQWFSSHRTTGENSFDEAHLIFISQGVLIPRIISLHMPMAQLLVSTDQAIFCRFDWFRGSQGTASKHFQDLVKSCHRPEDFNGQICFWRIGHRHVP